MIVNGNLTLGNRLDVWRVAINMTSRYFVKTLGLRIAAVPVSLAGYLILDPILRKRQRAGLIPRLLMVIAELKVNDLLNFN